jgi:hypothetical protein
MYSTTWSGSAMQLGLRLCGYLSRSLDLTNLPPESLAVMKQQQTPKSNDGAPRTSWTAGCDWRVRRVVDAQRLDDGVLLNDQLNDEHWLVAA